MRDHDSQDRPRWWIGPTLDARSTILVSIVVVIVLACLLARALSHDPVQDNDRRVDEETRQGQIARVAQAPDGATLWAVRSHGRLVLFSKGSVDVAPAS